MRGSMFNTLTLAAALALAPVGVQRAAAFCLFGGCAVTEAQAKTVFENMVKKRFDKPAQVVGFKTRMTEKLEMHATGEKGFEYFFDATVKFPEGANLECKPEGDNFPEGCSASKHYVTSPLGSDPKGKQYVEPGQTVVFDEEYRFYEAGKGWKGPDGNIYNPD